jgi:DNA polymerase III subunit gamma/tau
MAYQAFYNKYRPQTFDEVVGQKTVVETLKNAISEDKIAHAYLFCGPRGTGKTTMARLFAKALNCKEGIGHQCNCCDSCQGIMKGEQPDVFEIDAASNSTVDSVRQLIDNVSYQPIMSRYKVYIIDEVHNMSNSAFNALLKTLEEPPSFVIFILATTEPQKILPTILSRVQRFDFSKVSDKDLIANMERVLNSENIQYDKEALRLIADLSDGGVRDSLSLLDKLVSYSGENLTIQDVNDMLGLLSLTDEISILNLISQKKTEECIKLIKEKYDQGMDIVRLHDDLIKIYKDFIIYQTTQNASLMDRLNREEVQSMHMSLDEAKRNIQYLLEAKREYRNTDDVFSHFELTMLNLLSEFIPVQKVQQVVTTPKVEAKPEMDENTLISVANEVKSEKNEKGIDIAAKKEDPAKDKLSYNADDILNLMLQADKQERLDVAAKWPELSQFFFDTSLSIEAKALSISKVRLVAKNILVVSNKFSSEIDKINTKTIQPKLMDICEKTFNRKYNVLPILEEEYLEAIQKFKKGERPEVKEPTIDFGNEEKVSASTKFMDDLLG